LKRLALILTMLSAPAFGQQLDLRLAYVGRDTMFVDAASVVRDGDRRTVRALRIVPAEPIGGEMYFGGWLRAKVDCRARTFQGLAFRSLRETGVEGPESAIRQDPFPIVKGSMEDGVHAAVCRRRYLTREKLGSVGDAAAYGRRKIDENTAAMIRRGRG
jgi:hypothetical protein